MKAGVLYPRSNAHPDADLDFVDGIKSCLKTATPDRDVQLVLNR